jgi:hypothetical protein
MIYRFGLVALLLLSASGCDDTDEPVYTQAECVEYSVENGLSTVQCPDGNIWDGI